jgi:hypothetical protein
MRFHAKNVVSVNAALWKEIKEFGILYLFSFLLKEKNYFSEKNNSLCHLSKQM